MTNNEKDQLFESLFGGKDFAEMMSKITEHIVKDVSDDLENDRLNPDEDVVKATALMCFQKYSFDFLKSLNSFWNDNDEDIKLFIDKVEILYLKGEADFQKKKDEL